MDVFNGVLSDKRFDLNKVEIRGRRRRRRLLGSPWLHVRVREVVKVGHQCLVESLDEERWWW